MRLYGKSALLAVFLWSSAWAQDRVFLLDGEILEVLVQEIHPAEIHYAPADQPYGTVSTVPVSRILRIQYANGYTEWYTIPTPDRVLYRNGTHERGQVLEVGWENVSFRDSTGQTRTISRDLIDRLRFENGYEEIFAAPVEPEPSQIAEPHPDPAPIQPAPDPAKPEPRAPAYPDPAHSPPANVPIPTPTTRHRVLITLHAGVSGTTAHGPGLAYLTSWREAGQAQNLPHNQFKAWIMPVPEAYRDLYNVQGGLDLAFRLGKGKAYLFTGGQYARSQWQAIRTEHYRDPEYQFDAYWDSATVFTHTWTDASLGLHLQGKRIALRLAAAGSYRLTSQAEQVTRYREHINGAWASDTPPPTSEALENATPPQIVPGAQFGISFGRTLQVRTDLHWRWEEVGSPQTYSTLRLQVGLALVLGAGS